MSLFVNKNKRRVAKSRIVKATSMVLEAMESRVLMSTTITAWSFDSLTVTTTPNLSPAPSTGTGTALTVGLQTSSANTNSPGGVYAYPNPNASGTGDESDILNGTGNNPSGNQADHSSTGDTTGTNTTGINPAWRLRGTSDGWSDNAALASQGAQFMVPTTGNSGISLTFDLDPSSGSAPSEFAVEYTTNGGTTWTVVGSGTGTTTGALTSSGTDSSNGASDGVSIATNTSNANIVTGSYFQIANSGTVPDALFWQNGITADFSGINAANNNANFGVRIVNAATGSAEFEVGGTAFPAAGAGNWRIDNVVIAATGGVLTAPSVTNPTNQTVAAGQPVTFTASASGNPTPTVQWYEGTPGSGTAINSTTNPSAITNSLTFTTSSTASDNGTTYYAQYSNSQGTVDTTAATLNDPLAVPVVTTQPLSVTTTAGSAVSFTAAASGSPVPTVQWQVSTNGGSSWSNDTTDSGNTTDTLSFTSISAENNYEYRAVFTNSQAPGGVPSNAATLMLGGSLITSWTFPNSGTTVAGLTNLSPVPTTGTGTANSLGMGSAGTYSVYPGSNAAPFTLTLTDGSGTYMTPLMASNDVQTMTASGSSGSYQLVFGGQTTATLAFNAATSTIQADLTALTTINSGNVTVTGTTGAAVITFVGTMSGQAESLITVSNINDSHANTIAHTTTGGGAPSAAMIQADLQALNPATTGSITVTTNPAGGAATGVTLTSDPGATLTGSGTGTGFFVALDNSTLTTAQVTSNPDDSNLIASAETGLPNVDAANINAWRIVGSNGWNSNAPIGTQGAQFLTSTSGYSSIEVSFDLYATGQGEAKMQAEYTTDGTTWTNVPKADLSIGSGDTNISTQTNPAVGGSANTVTGGYFDITGGGSSNSWYNDLGINLTGITGVNNDANFGIRIVNAATGADCVNISNAMLNNTSGNDRLGDIQITGNNPTAPGILTNPVSASGAAGATVTFTASAYGYPAPTVQWMVSTNGGVSFTPDTTDAGNTTTTLSVIANAPVNGGDEYEAVFINSIGSATTTAATLAVGPIVTTQPISETVSAGATVNLVAAAVGTPNPTVQWQLSTNGGATFSNISGATSATYTFTATEGLTGYEYQAVFTNASGTATTAAATLTVVGTPITQWDFTSGEAPSPGGGVGSGNQPLATLTYNPESPNGGSGDASNVIGLTGDFYNGQHSQAEADILTERSSVNPSFAEYQWRVRGGSGSGPTGSPGTPDGWSQFAPVDTQGVQWNVNTTGYSNITLHFDWSYGGVGDMQPQYSPDGGSTWIDVPANPQNPLSPQNPPLIIQAYGNDYAGITSNTTPTGITVNLQGITAANNNPNFELRLVSAYDPGLPQISDENGLDPTTHGQYAGGFSAGGEDTTEGLILNDNGSFTLGFTNPLTGVTATTLSLSSIYDNVDGTPVYDTTKTASAIQAALGSLSNIGSANVTVTPVPGIMPVPGAGIPAEYTVEFKGTLKDLAVPLADFAVNGDSSDTIATWIPGSNVVETTTNASTSFAGLMPINLPVTSTTPFSAGQTLSVATGTYPTITDVSVVVNSIGTGTINVTPAATSTATVASGDAVILVTSTTTTAAATFTTGVAQNISVASSSAFSAGESVQITSAGTVIGDFLVNSVGSGTINVTDNSSVTNYSSGFIASGDTVSQLGISRFQDGSGSWTLGNISFNGDAVAAKPAVITQPVSTAVPTGNNASFVATDYSEESPNSVQWQISTNGGSTWSNVSTGNTFGGGVLNGSTVLSGTASSGTNDSTDLQLAPGTFNTTTANYYVGDTITLMPATGTTPGESSIITASTTLGVVTFGAVTSVPIAGSTGYVVTSPIVSTPAPGTLAFTSVLSFHTQSNLGDSGDEFRAVFTNPAGSTNSLAATLTVVAPQAPIIVTQPSNTSVEEGNVATFTAAAVGSPTPSVQWQINTGSGWSNLTDGTLSNGSIIVGSLTDTLNITATHDLTESGYQFRAVFTNQVSATNSNAATLTVLAPENDLTIWNFANHPASGNGTDEAQTMTVPATAGSYQLVFESQTTATLAFNAPLSTIQTALTALSTIGASNVTVTGTTSSAVITFVGTSADLPEPLITVFNDSEDPASVNTIAETAVGGSVFDNSPVPTGGIVDSGVLSTVGMDIPYNAFANNFLSVDPATGTDGNGAVVADDVTNTPGALNPSFNENTWRIRSGPTAITGGTPANGWSNLVPQYTQGLQATVPTTGYNNIYVTLDWYSTTSGELDAQEQYTTGGTTLAAGSITAAVISNSKTFAANTFPGNPNPVSAGDNYVATLTASNSFKFGDEVTVSGINAAFNGTYQIVAATSTSFSYYVAGAGVASNVSGATAYVPTWTNINNPVQAVSNDFYGATATGGPIPLVIDVSSIPGAANNPNFGIRLVNSYDPYLSNNQTLVLGDSHSFQLTFGGQTTGTIPYSNNSTILDSNIQTALTALSDVGTGNVSVSTVMSDPVHNGTYIGDIDVDFTGALNNVVQSPIAVVNDTSDSVVLNDQYANAALVGSPAVPAAYNGSKGNWRFDNIEVHGTEPLSFSATNYAVNENAGTVNLTVNRGGDTTHAITVEYYTTDGTAQSGRDYTGTPMATPATLTIPAGQSSANITVPIINVATVAGTRVFNVVLTSPEDTGNLAAPSSATVTITDSGAAVAPTLTSSIVGTGAVQRSTIQSVTVVFSEPVNFNAASFTLQQAATQAEYNASSWTDVSADVTATNPSADGMTWVISVNAGSAIDRTSTHGILKNGIYQLTLHGSAITDAATSSANYNGGADQIVAFNYGSAATRNAFAALFGDSSGTGNVNNTPYLAFKTTYGKNDTQGGYNALFDFDDNGAINNTDYLQFKNDYGATHSYVFT